MNKCETCMHKKFSEFCFKEFFEYIDKNTIKDRKTGEIFRRESHEKKDYEFKLSPFMEKTIKEAEDICIKIGCVFPDGSPDFDEALAKLEKIEKEENDKTKKRVRK